MEELPACFSEIELWMAFHYLLINAGKTEIIIFAKPSVLSKLKIHGTFITESVCIRFVSTAKNLGIYLDSQLTMTPHIMQLKKVCFNTMRKVAKMKSFLTSDQCELLIHALVFSCLDYCNCLYMGINSFNMQQLQAIQNRACRIIFGLKRHTSIDDFLKKLHWLKVRERIEFKVILLTYKCLNGLAPSYLSELLQYNNLSGSRIHSLKSSHTRSSLGNRSFSSCAPQLWNNLPVDLKQCQRLETFKRKLKTFLFSKSYGVSD